MQERGERKEERILVTLVSLYVHIMIRRLVPNLATEMHLTVRLLHVHSDVTRGDPTNLVGAKQGPEPMSENLGKVPTHTAPESRSMRPGNYQDERRASTTRNGEAVFKTGSDCRFFAANVLLGLEVLLPHIGKDILDVLAGSSALASEVRSGMNVSLCGSLVFASGGTCRQMQPLVTS